MVQPVDRAPSGEVEENRSQPFEDDDRWRVLIEECGLLDALGFRWTVLRSLVFHGSSWKKIDAS